VYVKVGFNHTRSS